MKRSRFTEEQIISVLRQPLPPIDNDNLLLCNPYYFIVPSLSQGPGSNYKRTKCRGNVSCVLRLLTPKHYARQTPDSGQAR